MQLNLQSVPSSIKSSIISDKRPSKVQRTSSSDTEPINTYVLDELKSIQESLLEIRATMMKKDNIINIVTDIVDGMNMDMNDLKEKFHEQLSELRNLKTNLQEYKS